MLHGDRHPFVLDSTMLRDNLIHTHYNGVDNTNLLTAARLGSFNLLAPDHIFDEVESHLAEWARQKGLEEANLREAWGHHLPLIRFVNVSKITPRDPRVLKITSDDYPCGVLGELIGPTHVLSNDKHLVKYGVGDPQWIIRAQQGRDVASGDIVVKGGGITVYASTELAVEAGKQAVRAIRKIDPLLLLVFALAAGYLLRKYVESGHARGHVEAVKKSAQFVADAFGPILIQSVAAETALEQTAFVPQSRTAVHVIGRVLGTASSGLTAHEIQSRLARLVSEGTHPIPVEQILCSNPAFVEAPAGFWWLGRLRAAATAAA
jgi:hypothetical protein